MKLATMFFLTAAPWYLVVTRSWPRRCLSTHGLLQMDHNVLQSTIQMLHIVLALFKMTWLRKGYVNHWEKKLVTVYLLPSPSTAVFGSSNYHSWCSYHYWLWSYWWQQEVGPVFLIRAENENTFKRNQRINRRNQHEGIIRILWKNTKQININNSGALPMPTL